MGSVLATMLSIKASYMLKVSLHFDQQTLKLWKNFELIFFPQPFALLKIIDAFSLILPYFLRVFSALKVKRFHPNFAIFFTHFLTNSENATKS